MTSPPSNPMLRAAMLSLAISVSPSVAAVRCVPLGHPGACTTFHSTIQAAVDAANDGDSILVAAGTYAEQVTVSGKSVSLLGARAGEDARGRSGPESVITHPDGPLSICGDGAAVDGFTLSGAVNFDASWTGLAADAASCGAMVQMRVENNIVEDNIVGMAIGAGPVRVRHNWIRFNDAVPEFSHGVLAGGASDWTLEENRFDGQLASSVTVYGPAARLTIARNRFDRGIALDRTVDSLLEGNIGVTPAPGITLLEFTGDDHRIAVRDNVLRADSGVAIRVSNGSGGPASSEVTLHHNCIVGLGATGLDVIPGTYTGTLDATSNWWGSATGPSGIGPGSGTAISAPPGVVIFVPFTGAGESAACDCAVVADSSPCEDGNPCTTADACSAGQCVGGGPPNCDDGDPCTIDSCQAPTGCAHTPKNCSDGNACTLGDACVAGNCVPGAPKNCDDGNFCTDDLCAAASGNCYQVPHNPPCDDNNPCTDDVCNPSDGSCSFVNDNHNVCATGGACASCSAGVCVPGCDDGIDCTLDACVAGVGCSHSPNHDACPDPAQCVLGLCDTTLGCITYLPNDGPCRIGCIAGRCRGGGTCVPGSSEDPCRTIYNCGLYTCDDATGNCVYHPDPCDDGNSCTTDSCVYPYGCRYTAPQCDDGDPCTNDFCTAAGECAHSAVSCDDGNPCTDDTCTAGACVSVTDDTNACAGSGVCTVGQCVNGACLSAPGPAAEIQGVHFSSKSNVTWNLAPSAPGFAYDVVRGALNGLPVGGSPGAETCLGHTTLNTLADPLMPGTGAAYWYLVRVSYSACDGTYGFQGINGAPGPPRVTGTCP